jgi:hypothetical protein
MRETFKRVLNEENYSQLQNVPKRKRKCRGSGRDLGNII